MKKQLLIFLFFILSPFFILSQNITIQGTQFYIDCNRIWLNGVNTPWNSWNDFGGNFDRNWWNTHFQTLKSKGINASRVWISCDGDGAVNTNPSGVTGVSATFWKDCDSLFQIAQRNGIYILATMMSFDHCQNNSNYQNWRDIITTQSNSQTFINNYLIPFVNRYKTNPYLFGIDLCNEPEWLNENASGGNLPVSDLQRFFGMCAAAIHSNSSVPVTVGSACIKWNSDNNGMAGNYWKNAALQAAFNDTQAYLDFYCIHYYGWMHQYFQSPFEQSPTDYGINDRPVIIAESPGNNSGLNDIPTTITQAYESALTKGYQGNFPWTSNGVDANGDITTIGPATLSFKNNHTGLVYPPACVSSVKETILETVMLYPNPANDILTIESASAIKEVIIFNSIGQRIYVEKNSMQKKATINVSSLHSGIYSVSIVTEINVVSKKINIIH